MKQLNHIEGEVWVPVILLGEPTYYSISNLGRVKSNYKGEENLIALIDNGEGYLRFTLNRNGKKYSKKPHRLVALAFIENPDNLPEVCHIDHDKYNNKVSNLKWGTKADNTGDSALAGKMSRGSRKLPPIKIGKYFAGICLKVYPSMGKAAKDGYARVSLSRRIDSNKSYRGFHWKTIID